MKPTILSLCLITILSYVILRVAGAGELYPIPQSTHIDKNDTFSDSLIEFAKYIGVCDLAVMYSQFAIESAYGTSVLAKRHNNLFAMRYPRKRYTTALYETRSKYSHYDTWQSSVVDYHLWIGSVCDCCSTRPQLIHCIGKRYAEDRRYVAKMQLLIDRFENTVN